MIIKRAILLYALIFSNCALSLNEYIESAALSSEGFLALGYSQGSIQLLNIHTNQITKHIKASDEMIGSLNFSHDNKMLVSTSGKQVKIWDFNNGPLLSSWKLRSPFIVTNASFSPENDTVLVSAYGAVKVYDLKGEEKYKLPEDSTARALFNHAGTKIAVSDYNRNLVSVYDVLNRTKVWSVESDTPLDIAFSPIGNRLAIASSLKIKLFELDKSNSIYEFDHSEELLHSFDNWFISLKYNNTGNRILFFDNQGCFFNLDLETKSVRHLQNLGSIKFSSFLDNGEIIVVTSRKILIIDSESMSIMTQKLINSSSI